MHDRGHLGQAQIIGNFLFINDLPGPLNPTECRPGGAMQKTTPCVGRFPTPSR